MIDVNKVMSVAERAIYIGAGKGQLFTADEIQALSLMLREAEKDAERYRWLVDNSVFGMKQNGASWSLSFDGPAPEHSGKIGEYIDQAMKEKCDE